MQLYIAYKYTHVKNKNELKVNLEHLVQLLENKGHTTFLLNRDAKAWGKKHVSTVKNITTIIKNITKAKTIVAYINSDVISYGIVCEFLLGRLLGKRIVACIDKKVEKSNKLLMSLSTVAIIFDGIKDLESKVDKVF